MIAYTDKELDMARKGYVYQRKTLGSNGARKLVKILTDEPRSELIFDWPAYEARHDPR